MSKEIKKFESFVKNMEVGLDLVNLKHNTIDITKYDLNESYDDPEHLKKAAETLGLDLTKNLSKRIDLI